MLLSLALSLAVLLAMLLAVKRMLDRHTHFVTGKVRDLEAHQRYQGAEIAELYERFHQAFPPTVEDRAAEELRRRTAGLTAQDLLADPDLLS